jgi:hypothetical protein
MSNKIVAILVYMCLIGINGRPLGNDHPSANINHIQLLSDVHKDLKESDQLTLECPMEILNNNKQERSSLHETKQEEDIQSFKKSAIITSWYKDGTKLNQFSLEEVALNHQTRVQIIHRRFRIKSLLKSDSGVYMCEMVTGTGLTVNSKSLVLQVHDKLAKPNLESAEYDEYDNQENNKLYVKGGMYLNCLVISIEIVFVFVLMCVCVCLLNRSACVSTEWNQNRNVF